MNRKWMAIVAVSSACIIGGLLLFLRSARPPKGGGPASATAPFPEDKALQAELDSILDHYRKIIVLMDGAESLDENTRAHYLLVGRKIFARKQQALNAVTQKLTAEYQQAAARDFRKNTDGIRQLIHYLSANPTLRDADKLAFLDLVEELASLTPGSAPNPLADPLKGLTESLQSIQLAYRAEVTRIFSQFLTRGEAGAREKWEAYVRYLKGLIDREKILAEFDEGDADESLAPTRGDSRMEIFGYDFAPKTVALTFDDGPHHKYTEQVLALLRKYDVKACFFEVGRNLGTVSGDDQVKLSPTAEVAKKILEAGHVLANHSYSHHSLPKLSEADRAREIHQTNQLLEKIAGRKPDLFRPPYGARNQKILQTVTTEGLRSVMWTIDSLDWADPIPESIALRVLHELNRAHKGIILFHDIHKQSVAALPQVLEELTRQEYTFLTFADGRFIKATKPSGAERAAPEAAVAPAAGAKPSLYRQSWAVIIGINDYQQWPKLRYCVNDANAVEETLITKFGFPRGNVRKLLNGEATRQRIMALLGDEFADSNKVQREDRVFFFFAGHGATRALHDGREVGFIVPVDADRSNYYSTAISMTALRDACDLIAAKHIYFVMDSCYSGLALTRGAGAFAHNRTYLEEITRRTARQILTAGGADQQVADDGPSGHSVFTWALLQGLQGPADLDGNGVITASEIGAYVSPIVASFSKQTPAVGNLVGSEGGEFIFELQPEPLSAQSQQLEGKALQLNEQLSALQKEIAAKQARLLQLQQSIQAETVKLEQLAGARGAVAAADRRAVSESPVQVLPPDTRGVAAKLAPPRKKPPAARAYELDRQGRQLYREKKYDLALKKFQEAVQLKPGDPVLLNNLGYIYYKMDRPEEALAWLQKTLAADPKRKEAHGNIADVYLQLGRRGEAKTHYEQYLVLSPASPRADEVRKILQTLN